MKSLRFPVAIPCATAGPARAMVATATALFTGFSAPSFAALLTSFPACWTFSLVFAARSPRPSDNLLLIDMIHAPVRECLVIQARGLGVAPGAPLGGAPGV